MACVAACVWALDGCVYALQAMGRAWGVVENFDEAAKDSSSQSESRIYRQQYHSSASPCGGKPQKKGDQALGRSRGGFGTKLHIIIDPTMRLLDIVLTPGQRDDSTQAHRLIKTALNQGIRRIVADRAYDTNAIMSQIRIGRGKAIIPPRSNRKFPRDYNKDIYRQRNIAERFIARLKENRRVATRYDKLASHYLGFVLLATIMNYLKIIC